VSRRFPLALLWFLAWGVGAFAVVVYAFLPFGANVHPELREGFEARRGLVITHAFAASLALLLGPTQFWRRLRARRPGLHRVLGRCYLAAGVGLGGVTGLLLAQHAFGGAWAQAGFSALALAWLGTGAAALAAIRRGDVAAHRRWMLRNFALSLAAVTLRLALPATMLAGVPLATAYAAVAWLCWVPQVLLLEWTLARRPAMPHRVDLPA
jgi:uncharacterized membrane protein